MRQARSRAVGQSSTRTVSSAQILHGEIAGLDVDEQRTRRIKRAQ